MQLMAHLGFNGQAEEAMSFYVKTLGGKFEGEMFRNPENPDRILHCMAKFDNFSILATDSKDIDQSPGNIDLHLFFKDVVEAKSKYDMFAQIGQVDYPFEVQPWGDYFGRVIDPWGIPWCFTVEG